MSEDQKAPRRMGRPPKAPEKGRRQNYTFRMSDTDRDLVVEAAAKAGRSISEEIEHRIIESFKSNVVAEAASKLAEDTINRLVERADLSVEGIDTREAGKMVTQIYIDACKTADEKFGPDVEWNKNPYKQNLIISQFKSNIDIVIYLLHGQKFGSEWIAAKARQDGRD